MHSAMTNYLWKSTLTLILALGLVCAICVPAIAQNNFNTLASFDYTDGAYPTSFTLGSDGNFYGTTDKGGVSAGGCNQSCGAIFKVSGSTLTLVHAFIDTDGNGPSGLVQSSSGEFYGTTSYGGSGDCTSWGSPSTCGTVFKMSSTGTVTTLYDFCALSTTCTDGAIPWGGVAMGSDGNLYGTASAGGTGVCSSQAGPGCGTVFKITTAGVLTTLHNFVGNDGAYPFSRLIQGSDGSLYGVTTGGGTHGFGTVFKITTGGTLTTLYNFAGTDGGFPYGPLVQASNGNFYGTTSAVSWADFGNGPSCIASGAGEGTVFEITSGGSLTTLHTFSGTDGSYPFPGVIQGADGNFYGMTTCGGASGYGTIFQLTSTNTLNTLYNFSGTDGANPFSSLVQASNGTFYGAPVLGAANNYGSVFSLTVGSTITVTVAPTALSFGSVAIDTTSASKTVTLTNTGTASVSISSIAITAGNSFFAISSNACGSTLAAGKKCTVKVTFSPGTVLGTESGTLSFTVSATGSPQTVSLSGTGVAQATLTPAKYTFAKTKVGMTSAAKTFTLKNNLGTTLTGISYSTKAPFAVSTSTCTSTLAGKKSCTISVTFSPTQTGTASGSLTVKDSANNTPQTASLSGTGD